MAKQNCGLERCDAIQGAVNLRVPLQQCSDEQWEAAGVSGGLNVAASLKQLSQALMTSFLGRLSTAKAPLSALHLVARS